MTREEKNQIIDSLADEFSQHDNFYITDISELTVEKSNQLRRQCFGKQVKLRMAKNTLIKKALEKIGPETYQELFVTLKGTSAIMFCEAPNSPARLIKSFRKDNDKPVLKGAYIDTAVFVGEEHLETLVAMKSRLELIGDIVGLLQSPAKNVISALNSAGGKISGILETLEQRGSENAS